MADEIPRKGTITVGQPSPQRQPPAFESELGERIRTAQEAYDKAHPSSSTAPLEAPAPVEPSPEVPAELPEPTEPAAAPEPEPAPQVTPALAEPPATPQQAKPEAPATPEPPQQPIPWRDLRRLERENRKLQRELEEARKSKPAAVPETQPAPQAPAPAQPQPVDDNDPFGVKAAAREEADRIIREREGTWQQQQQQEEQRRITSQIDNEEAAFRQQHPDYNDAVNHLANWERGRYQRSGAAFARAQEMLIDPKWQPVVERVADEFVFVPDPDRPNTVLAAKRTELTGQQLQRAREMSDTEAAACLATDLWIAERRNEVIAGARATRRTVPEQAYALACEFAGYQPKAAPPAGSAAPAAPAAPSVAERLRQQAKVSAASKTLSNTSGGGPSPEPARPAIRTLAEFMDLQRKDPVAARAYMNEMSRKDPQWHRNLAN